MDGWLNYTGRIMRLVVAGFALALGGVLGLGGGACFAQQAKKSAAPNPKKNVWMAINQTGVPGPMVAKSRICSPMITVLETNTAR